MEEYTASTCTIGLCGIRLKLPNTKVRQRPCPCMISTNAFSMKLLAEAYTRTGAMAEADAEVKKLTGLNNSDHRSSTRRASCPQKIGRRSEVAGKGSSPPIDLLLSPKRQTLSRT